MSSETCQFAPVVEGDLPCWGDVKEVCVYEFASLEDSIPVYACEAHYGIPYDGFYRFQPSSQDDPKLAQLKMDAYIGSISPGDEDFYLLDRPSTANDDLDSAFVFLSPEENVPDLWSPGQIVGSCPVVQERPTPRTLTTGTHSSPLVSYMDESVPELLKDYL